MGNGRTNFALSARNKIAKQSKAELSPDRGERVAVEEEKGGLAVKSAQPVKRFPQRQRFEPEDFPFRRARLSSFRVSAMLCSTSFARSSVDADNNVPVPVFEKLGSGLKR